VRRVAGLSASSFAKTGGTGFTADAGTTLGAAPTKEKMTVEEAQQSVAYSAVTSRPTCDRPPFVVPEAVAAAGVEGQIRVVFDVSDTGQVQRVRVTGRLHPEADAACVAAWTKARCTPGQQGGTPVTVTNMPYYCTIKAID
jgi:TonB family protein